MCVCELHFTEYMYVFIVFNLYMCIQLYSAKGINDVALNKIVKFVCLFEYWWRNVGQLKQDLATRICILTINFECIFFQKSTVYSFSLCKKKGYVLSPRSCWIPRRQRNDLESADLLGRGRSLLLYCPLWKCWALVVKDYPPPKKKKKKKKKKVLDHYLHRDLGMPPLLWWFFAHLLILEYPDYHQNLISSSLYYPGPLRKISSQSVHNFLSNVAHRQTKRQTNATKNITSFAT